MTCRFAAVYLAVALSSTALATVQSAQVPEAEVVALLAADLSPAPTAPPVPLAGGLARR